MITEKQLKIFEVFAKEPFAEFTRKKIKADSKEKSNNAISLMLNSLKEDNVLHERKIGKSGLLTLNLENNLTFYYLSICNEKRISAKIKQLIVQLNKAICKETIFYSLILFGSYASGKNKKDSDLDVAIFIEDKNIKKKIEAVLNEVKLKSMMDLDLQVIPKDEMIEMLLNDEENLGKQIVRKHIAVHNQRIFYDIIKRAIRNGFRT